jgi:DNA-binding NtrC family response regulator
VKTKGRVFLLDDDELIVSMLTRALRREGYQVQAETDPHGVLDKVRAFAPEIVLLDIKLPGASGLDLLRDIVDQSIARQVVMLTSDDSAETAVTAMKLGAADYLTKPFDLEEVKIVVGNVIEKGALRREVDYLRRVSSELIDRPFVGESAVIEKLKQQAVKLARAEVTLFLIVGESGTGKEVLARYIHRMRHGEDSISTPFIGINCAALPETLIESELFGHVKGAFTDAKTDKKGVCEMAYGGSILLDEIGEMKPSLQSKLLRVLEERVIRRVGGRREIAVDATVFATTNKNLEKAVGTGEFRQDLYYRLNAFPLLIPPLRERPDDIPVLARHFLGQFASTLGGFSSEAMSLLRSYAWPGNVRELRNVVERITVLESGDAVLPEHLPRAILNKDEVPTATGGTGFSLPATGLSLDEVERSLIAQALEMSGGNKTKAAKLLDLTYDTLRYQIKKFGLG